MIEIIESSQYRKMLWKNGAGFTFEIAKFPKNTEDFDWRISMADVTTSGLFSNFENKWRYISVLEGNGLTLKVNQEPAISIKAFELFSFDGTFTVDCGLISGNVRDFNLIFNPKKYHAQMQWLSLDSNVSLLSSADQFIIFNPCNAVTIDINQQKIILEKMATLKICHSEQPIALFFPQQCSQKLCMIELNQR